MYRGLEPICDKIINKISIPLENDCRALRLRLVHLKAVITKCHVEIDECTLCIHCKGLCDWRLIESDANERGTCQNCIDNNVCAVCVGDAWVQCTACLQHFCTLCQTQCPVCKNKKIKL